MSEYSHLLAPLQVAGLTLKSRLLSAPTSLAELGPEEHYSQDNINYYKLRAAGGAALVTVGDVIVDLDTGRSHPQQVGINDPSALPYLIAVADAIHSQGAAAGVEIDHGGALCSPEFLGGRNAMGPSGYVDEWGDTVEEMTEADMEHIAGAFAQGAAAAKACGFDLVMIHGGHGWLLHQFLSPLTNHRTDRWGGSLENRLRFPLMVIDRVRQAVGRSYPIEFRMSGSERTEGGYGLDTGIEIAKAIDGKVDLIHVSAGTQQDPYSAVLMHPGVFQREGENSGLAAEIKKHVKTPVVSVGAFSDPAFMENFLAEGHADAIALGRALVADPFLPKKLLRGTPEKITPCIRCGECQSGMIASRCIRCTVNPLIGREQDFFHPLPVRQKRRVLVAGGGPGGLEAALDAHEKGHEVVLCEQNGKLGGALKYADTADFKAPMKRYRDSQIAKVFASGIEVRLNTRVDETVVREVKPDVLIIAVGGTPLILPVPGADGKNVFIGADLDRNTPLGETVVVIGGGLIGCEEAVQLARTGHKVTILEMQEELAPDCGRMHRLNLLHQLENEPNITPATGMTCKSISLTGVAAADRNGAEVTFPCQSVVMAAGTRANVKAVNALRSLVPEYYVVGDARRASKVMMAVRDAYDAVVDMAL